jgi:ribose transport system ATP-binding protein
VPVNRLEVQGLTKSFGASTVLDHVDISIREGEVRGLIGQNGAGKSTLVKTLAGLYPDHSGRVAVDGTRLALRTPQEARRDGLAVIYQEFSLVSQMTVAENILLGREPGRYRYSRSAIDRRAERLVADVGIEIGARLDAPVAELSPAVRQRIEIVKALADNVRVLIMDEPTARLAEAERAELFAVVRDLSERGVAVILISHYLDEVREHADAVTIMRNGRVVATEPTAECSVDRMASLMLGEDLAQTLAQEAGSDRSDDSHPVFYEARAVSYGSRLDDVSISLRAGEITGVAGLVGSGRTRLCRLLAGADAPTAGTLSLHGRDVSFDSPHAALARGIAFIPEDRATQALSMQSSIADNVALMSLQRGLSARGFVSRRRVNQLAKDVVRDFQIVPADPGALVGTLSGGNQQKVVLAKALSARPDVVIIDQPTAGVDVGTKSQIHRLLRERAEAGAAVLVVSDDLEELYALSDRFEILKAGRHVHRARKSSMDFAQLVQLIASGAAA